MATFRACGAEIVFARTPQGKNMPLDAGSKTMFVVEGGAGTPVTCKPIQVRTPHWATCTSPDEFRRGS